MPAETSLPLFISYSHQDKKYLDRLKVFLKPLARDGDIDAWDDTRIKPGQRWKDEIEKALNAAKVAVLLVGPDYLASDAIADDQLPPLLDAAKQKGVVFLYVVVGGVSLKRYPEIAAFRAVNDINVPLAGLPPHEQDAIWRKVVEQIEEVLAKNVSGTPPQSAGSTGPQVPPPVPSQSSTMVLNAAGAPETASPEINVFISYSHEGAAHEAKALALADRLRGDGITAQIDQYHPFPPEGWPQWMDAQIRKADFVLMVCTPTYYQRVMREQAPGTGLGVTWEALLIYQHLYDAGGKSGKFIPLLFDGGTVADIPEPVRGKTYFRADTDAGYEALYRVLTNQPATPPPTVGGRRTVAPQPRTPNP